MRVYALGVVASVLFWSGIVNAGEESVRMTPEGLQSQLAAALPDARFPAATDEQFLRRVSLDLIGRQPTPEELTEFLASSEPNKRAAWIERLLAHPDFGANWANYWSDTIAYRTPPPELTFLNYDPLKAWLAQQLNDNARWDAVVKEILSATGKVKDNPPVTFVAYHEAHAQRLAAETARIFMSVQIGCAQCHDHPFDDWKREQFHELAAYFARASVKFPWNEGAETEVKDKGKGEYEMPNATDPTKKGTEMLPTFLTGEKYAKGKSDVERRQQLAEEVASADNPWFARAYVNRVWAKLMGRGFYEPVDDFGPAVTALLPEIHEALASEFRDSGFDVKALFRVILNTPAYQQQLSSQPSTADTPFAAARATKLAGDQVFASLVAAIELPNVTPPKMAATKEIRFPPPPKSTRDLIAEAFAFDPSARGVDVNRTLQQAMLMMNQDQLQRQIDARPDSGTVLARLLKAEPDNRRVVERMFLLLFARQPSEKEVSVALEHISSVGDRAAGFEDVLWSLLNSAEFTTKR
jgi:hypothetical protein